MSEAKTYRPEELASELGISGKVLRAHLRKEYTRPAEAKNTAWVLPASVAREVKKHFIDLRPAETDES